MSIQVGEVLWKPIVSLSLVADRVGNVPFVVRFQYGGSSRSQNPWRYHDEEVVKVKSYLLRLFVRFVFPVGKIKQRF